MLQQSPMVPSLNLAYATLTLSPEVSLRSGTQLPGPGARAELS